jgi:hypothetical protein
MPLDPYAPIFAEVDVDDTGETVDLGVQCGQIDMRSLGPDPAFFAPGVVLPATTVGADRYGILANEALPTIRDTAIQKLSFRCATGKTAKVEIVAIPAARSEGGTQAAVNAGSMNAIIGGGGAAAGQLIKWTTPSWSGTLNNGQSSPTQTTVCNVDITGCRSLVAQVDTITAHSDGDLKAEVQFDGGAWVALVSTAKVKYATNAVYTPGSGAVDCTGKSAITGLRLSIKNNGANGESLAFGGGLVWLNASPVAIASAVAV